MASDTQTPRLAFEASIRANAVSYSVHLFLGRGQFDRAEADTLEEAIAIGNAMKTAHPNCQARPIYYAIEPSGHSTTIIPAQFKESTNMIKIAVTTESAAINAAVGAINDSVMKTAADLRREKNAERMRAARAKAKEAKERPAPEESKSLAEIVAEAAPGNVEAKITQVAEALGVQTPAPAPRNGLANDRAEAIRAAREVYGHDAKVGDDFQIKKTARGEWFWGPIAAAKAAEAAKPASKPAKADQAPKATEASATAKPASGKRAEALAAAQRGEIPTAPDFTAATHTRFRGKLAEVVALVEAGNIAGLEAFKINPVSSSPKAIDKYRNLAIVALKARAS